VIGIAGQAFSDLFVSEIVRRRSTALAGMRLFFPAVLAALATFATIATPAAAQTVPTITISGGAAVTEGDDVTFVLRPSPSPLSAAITVNLSVSEASGSDFVAATDEGSTTRNMASGATFAAVTVPTQNDDTDEPNGSVTVTVMPGTGYTVGSPSSATRVVNDNDDSPANSAPVFTSQPSTATVAENSAGGTAVVTIKATDSDSGDTVTHSLDSTSDAVFDINGSSGAITVQSGADLDFESKSSYTATVTATDGTDSVMHDVTITVTDRDEPPPAPAAPTVTAASASSVTVNWTAPDMTGKPAITDYDVQYRASGLTAWTEHAFTGTGTSTTISSLNSGTTYQVQVKAINAEGDTWSATGSGKTNDPTITISGGSAVTEGTSAAFTVTANTAPGADLTVKLTVSEAAGSDFVASAGEGAKTVTISSGTASASYSVTTQNDNVDESNGSVSVEVASGTGYTVGTASSATVTVNDDDHTPVFTSQPTTGTVAENSGNGTAVSTGSPPVSLSVVATDADTGTTLSYSLDATSDNVFDINSSGAITVGNSSALDFEAKSSYTAIVTASDGANTASHTVTINVTDQDEPPAAPAAPTVTGASASSVTVNWTAPTNTGKPAINDYDVRFRVSGETTWTMHAFTGTGTTTTISSLSSGTTYQVQVMAQNAEGGVNWSPTGSGKTNDPTITISGGSAVTEGTAAAFTVSANTAPGANLTVNLTVSDASGSDFVATADEGANTVTINAGAASATYSVTTQGDSVDEPNASVKVEVATGTGYTVGTASAATVTVNDDDHTPVFTNPPATATVAENSDGGTAVATVVATDADTGETVTHSLDSTSDALFDIDGSTGAITVQNGADLNFEGTQSYTATVTATDGTNSARHNVAISVTDVNEPPDAPAAPTVTAGASGRSASSIDVSWTAPSTTGKPPINGYDVQYQASGATSWTSHSFTGTGTSTTISSLDAATTYDVQVKAKNDEGDKGWSAAGSGATKSRPVFTSQPTTATVPENSGGGTAVATAVATDADSGDTVTHSLDAASDALFNIDGSSGAITVQSGADLNYEGTRSYTATVTATDGTNSAAHNVTISVTDELEPPSAPGAPSVSSASTTSVRVSWTAPDMTGKPPITDYDVRYRIANSNVGWFNDDSVHPVPGTNLPAPPKYGHQQDHLEH